uniref:Uncharacterized protein n=1 Tax=Anguilla anguilla TaxID=7936 RepID=A0A0E9W7Q9_ANGAN
MTETSNYHFKCCLIIFWSIYFITEVYSSYF